MKSIPIDFNKWPHYKELFSDKELIVNFNPVKTSIKIFVNSKVDNTYINNNNIFKVFMQTEPRPLQESMLLYVEQNYNLFDLILTHDEKLLLLPNSVLFQPLRKYFWVRPPLNSKIDNLFFKYVNHKTVSPIFDEFDYTDKKFIITMICGHKTTAYGNRLRIACWNKQNEIKIPKRCYKSYTMGSAKIFPDNINTKYKCDKTEMFVDSMFHVAIENSSYKNYFTEKIHDCFLTHTIPIYWGCPNISDFYNSDGIIFFKDQNDFIEKINQLTPELYFSKIDAINENYEKFINLQNTWDTLKHILSNIK